MLRSGFCAFGLFVLLWGISFLSIDRIVLAAEPEPEEKDKPSLRKLVTTINEENKYEIAPPDWAAYSLMSIGAVTILYSVALPRKQ